MASHHMLSERRDGSSRKGAEGQAKPMPPRSPISKRVPAMYAVNSLPINGKRNFAPRRKDPNRVANLGHRNPNPNLIPLPEVSRYSGREPGEVTDNLAPSWLDDPIT